MDKGLKELLQRLEIEAEPYEKMNRRQVAYADGILSEPEKNALTDVLMKIVDYNRLTNAHGESEDRLTISVAETAAFGLAGGTLLFIGYYFPGAVVSVTAAAGVALSFFRRKEAREMERRELEAKMAVLERQASPEYQKASARAEALSLMAPAAQR